MVRHSYSDVPGEKAPDGEIPVLRSDPAYFAVNVEYVCYPNLSQEPVSTCSPSLQCREDRLCSEFIAWHPIPITASFHDSVCLFTDNIFTCCGLWARGSFCNLGSICMRALTAD